MPTLEEEFAAYKQTHAESKKFQLEQDYRAYLRDQAQGGSIRQAPPGEAGNENFPIGSVIGGIGGAVVGGTAAGPLGAVVGSVYGAGVGQLIQGRTEMAIGDKNAPKDTEEETYRIGREALLSGATETVGQGIGFLVPKIRGLAPFAPAVTPEAKEAMKFVEQHGGIHTSLLPAEMTSNRFLDIMQNISEHSLLGGGAISMFKADRDLFNTKLAETIVQRQGPHMHAEDVGRAVVDAATKNLEAAKYQSKFI